MSSQPHERRNIKKRSILFATPTSSSSSATIDSAKSSAGKTKTSWGATTTSLCASVLTIAMPIVGMEPPHPMLSAGKNGLKNGKSTTHLTAADMSMMLVHPPLPFGYCCCCLVPYERPVCIPCGHVYCDKCLRDYISARLKVLSRHSRENETQSTHMGGLECPTCRKEFKKEDMRLIYLDTAGIVEMKRMMTGLETMVLDVKRERAAAATALHEVKRRIVRSVMDKTEGGEDPYQDELHIDLDSNNGKNHYDCGDNDKDTDNGNDDHNIEESGCRTYMVATGPKMKVGRLLSRVDGVFARAKVPRSQRLSGSLRYPKLVSARQAKEESTKWEKVEREIKVEIESFFSGYPEVVGMKAHVSDMNLCERADQAEKGLKRLEGEALVLVEEIEGLRGELDVCRSVVTKLAKSKSLCAVLALSIFVSWASYITADAI